MTGESTRLGRYLVPLSVVLSCGAAIAQNAPSSQPGATQATQPSATQSAPAAVDLEVRIGDMLKALPTMGAADTVSQLGGLLLDKDVSKVAGPVRAKAYIAVAGAYEKRAQDARADRLDPAAEQNARKLIGSAVENYIKAGKAAQEPGGDLATADRAFKVALSWEPKNPEALLGAARVLGATGRAMQAIERYQAYFQATGKGPLGPYEPQLYVDIGKVYLSASMWHQSLKYFKLAVNNGKDTDDVAGWQAEAYLGLGKMPEALEQVQKAIDKSQGQPIYHSRYAQILLGQNKLPEAKAKAEDSIKVAQKWLEATPDGIDRLQAMGQCHDVYIKVLQAILAGDPGDTNTRLRLVACMQDQAYVNRLLALHRALAVIQYAPEKDRNTNKAMLEKQVTLEQTVFHHDLPQTCDRLLAIDPDNKIAKEAKDKLSSKPATSAPASAPSK